MYETMVFCYQNCSDLLLEKKCSSNREKLLKFEAEGREFATFLRSLEYLFEQEKGRIVFETELFFNLFLEVSLRSGTLEQLKFKSEKIIEI